MEDYIDLIVSSVTDDFWENVAENLPLIKSGDLPPEAVNKFKNQCRDIIIEWIEFNKQ